MEKIMAWIETNLQMEEHNLSMVSVERLRRKFTKDTGLQTDTKTFREAMANSGYSLFSEAGNGSYLIGSGSPVFYL